MLPFVRDRVLQVLEGRVESVVRGLRRLGASRGLRGSKLKTLRRVCAVTVHFVRKEVRPTARNVAGLVFAQTQGVNGGMAGLVLVPTIGTLAPIAGAATCRP